MTTAKPPSSEQIAATVAELDRLRVPVSATIAEVCSALRAAGERAGTSRARLAQRSRQARDGIETRAPKVTAGTGAPRAFALLAELVDGRLLGAACVGRHEIFDERRDGEREPARAARHRAAAEICRTCPVLGACAAVRDELGDKAAGVWAGSAQQITSTK